MKEEQQIRKVPRSRIATFDVFAIGMEKHHVAALLEADVTAGRRKLRELKRGGAKVSFNAWLVKAIAAAVRQHPVAAAFLRGKKKLVVFAEVRVSFLVEKKIGAERVPVPLVIANAGTKTVAEIASEIEASRGGELGESEVVLNNRKTKGYEKLYYLLPGFLRRFFWKLLLRRPQSAFRIMGNVAVTSLGMIGRINGWFVHRGVHPLCVGLGSVLKKPVVSGDKIEVREILNMTLLLDHDALDGAPMARFVNELSERIASARDLEE